MSWGKFSPNEQDPIIRIYNLYFPDTLPFYEYLFVTY